MAKKGRQYNVAKIVSSANGAKTTALSPTKNNLDTDFIYNTKINLNWIIDLNIKYETVKFLEDNIGENLNDLNNLRCGNNFLDKPQA